MLARRPGPRAPGSRQLAGELKDALEAATGPDTVTIAIGGPCERPADYAGAFATTRRALEVMVKLGRRGSVVGSWLLDLTAQALVESPTLEEFAGRVSDSGEGRWTSIAAIEEGVPAPVLTTALYSRFASRGLDDFANRLLSAMRKQFGGHDEKAS